MEKKINHYDLDSVLEAFNIEIADQCLFLQEWLNIESPNLTHEETHSLELARKRLVQYGNFWNEEELKMKFVSVVLNIADLDEPKKMQVFFERTLTGIVEGFKIWVKCDCMVAKPKTPMKPAAPYFFLQEFKRTKSDIHDPEGQMLAAMVMAREFNQDNYPVYGCWLQGKNWNFTTLLNKNYCVSRQYDATNSQDLVQIVFILRKLKELILNR